MKKAYILNKNSTCFCIILLVLILSLVTVSTISTTASCTINLGNPGSVESASVGLSKSADFTTTSYSDSFGIASVICYAAWAGWPYTNEGSMTVPAGRTGSLTVTQSRNSNFYIRIWATAVAGTHAFGKVSLN